MQKIATKSYKLLRHSIDYFDEMKIFYRTSMLYKKLTFYSFVNILIIREDKGAASLSLPLPYQIKQAFFHKINTHSMKKQQNVFAVFEFIAGDSWGQTKKLLLLATPCVKNQCKRFSQIAMFASSVLNLTWNCFLMLKITRKPCSPKYHRDLQCGGTAQSRNVVVLATAGDSILPY